MQGNAAVVATELQEEYNEKFYTTGYNFTYAIDESGCQSQNVEPFGDSWFGASGLNMDNGDGVCMSNDYGMTFDFFNVTELKTDSRYGAYPSLSTWYLSAGEWPRRNRTEIARKLTERTHSRKRKNKTLYRLPNGATEYLLNKRITVHKKGKTVRHHVSPLRHGADRARRRDELGMWAAQLVKTSDGGKTWVSQFYVQGEFYFNEISCGSETHCCAVGEADNDSPKPGIRIYCTWDGGSTWKRTYFDPNPAMSLMAIDFVSDTEAWAAGGELDDNFTGVFLHTLDGGKTWDNSITVDGVYGNAMSWPSPAHGFATAFNVLQQSSFLEYK